MLRLKRLPYILLLSTLSTGASAQVPWPQQCEVRPDWLQFHDSSDDTVAPAIRNAVQINADHVEVLYNNHASYQGNVELQFNDQRLRTEEAEYNQISGEIQAFGGLYYSDGYVAVRGDSFSAQTLQQSAQLTSIDYHLLGTSALGSARELDIESREGYRNLNFRRASFTTCPGERPAWQVRARRIEMNEDESWGVAHGAQVRIFDVPVIYVPRFSFPLTDERKTGLLYPTVRSSARNGLELEVPYYINLAHNYDATLTPRYMSERGLMGMAEGRYLTDTHQGQVNVEYLHTDDALTDNSSRSFWRVEHLTEFSSRWSGYIEASGVSDMNYLNDFGSNFFSRADAHLYRRGQADYRHRNWQAQVQVEDFQMLGPYRSPYRTIPRISVWHEGDLPRRQGFRSHWFTELTQFSHQDRSDDRATRFHTEPGLTYHMRRPGWEWQAETSMLMTHYEQQNYINNELERSSVTRTMPQFRWHGLLNFERPLDFAAGTGSQTLQPQAQFLYIPYRDQRHIGVYDTVPMQDDYSSLFRPRRFAGLDRIADANQVTLGATTSIFNHRAEELMRLSLGQIFYFDDSQTELFDESTRITDANSELAAELDFRLSERWFFSMAAQYDRELNQVQKSRSAVEYRKDNSNLIQLNHRQVRGLIGTETDVEQVGIQSTWQLAPAWSVAGHWYHDLRNSSALDVNIGVQYERCCWALRVSAYRRIDRSFEGLTTVGTLPPAEFDNGVGLQFVITGLSGDRTSLIGLLQQGVFGYRRPFYLSN